MNIQSVKNRPHYIQCRRYSKETRQPVLIGGMSILERPPEDLWAALTAAERAQLLAYLADAIRKLDVRASIDFALSLPDQLDRLADVLPEIKDQLGDVEALLGRAKKSFSALQRSWRQHAEA